MGPAGEGLAGNTNEGPGGVLHEDRLQPGRAGSPPESGENHIISGTPSPAIQTLLSVTVRKGSTPVSESVRIRRAAIPPLGTTVSTPEF